MAFVIKQSNINFYLLLTIWLRIVFNVVCIDIFAVPCYRWSMICCMMLLGRRSCSLALHSIHIQPTISYKFINAARQTSQPASVGVSFDVISLPFSNIKTRISTKPIEKSYRLSLGIWINTQKLTLLLDSRSVKNFILMNFTCETTEFVFVCMLAEMLIFVVAGCCCGIFFFVKVANCLSIACHQWLSIIIKNHK